MIASPKPRNHEPDEGYMLLVRAFPLVPIRDAEHLERAVAVVDDLIDRPHLSASEQDYLDVLSDLIERYEQDHVEIPAVSGVAVLKHLMEEHGLKQADLVSVFGSKSIVSEVLAGKRRLALTHIKRLSQRFGLPADTFIQP